uniref:DUF5710 domain-containing protein n=1 Tax=Aplanochytrium stocchinoi TaxID=215587 RepID=A0A7S3PD45_9STRA|mmetsp:Transcript_6392/g.7751  ORF Transcript_6392/g.7751 Transcript_6392/m.7751 type:complete len:295 (-) Transcript_6392:682-1566(-)
MTMKDLVRIRRLTLATRNRNITLSARRLYRKPTNVLIQARVLSSLTEPKGHRQDQIPKRNTSSRVDLRVPFAEKEEAKRLGARWDYKNKVWYAPNGEAELSERWLDQRVYLDVPFTEKAEAKSLGARWDKREGLWYAPNAEPELISRWSYQERFYFDIPYKEREFARLLGCKWDSNWSANYASADNENIEEIKRKYVEVDLNKESVELHGEDRTFLGNRLFIDLIPSTCWFSNARSCISPSDWGRLRKHILTRASFKCECCGSNKNLEVHERWDYNDNNQTQKLKRLILLCKPW